MQRFGVSLRPAAVKAGPFVLSHKQVCVRLGNHRCRAAGAAGEDPYQVLGLSKGADSAKIDNAYRRKKREAELAQDQALLARIEAAHSALFMDSLSARLSGSGPKDASVRYADKEKLFPWLPKYFPAPQKLIAIAAAVYAVIGAYYLLLTTNPQGVVPAAMAGFGLNTYRQYQMFPVDQFAAQQEKMEKGWKNILRGALLAVLATACGVFAFYSAPDYIASALGKVLPIWFYENQAAILTVGSVVSNFLYTAFLR